MNNLSIGKVVCVGRNYAAHAAELGNEVPTQPLLFIKPASSVHYIEANNTTSIAASFYDIPRDIKYDVHYEAELCVQLGKELINASIDEVKDAINAVTVGLDLTLRDLQTKLKDKAQPWERAKCFVGSCVLGEWVSPDSFGDFTDVQYQLYINDTLTQDGDTALMLFPVYQLLVDISHAFGLQVGDVVMTGTPAGVGKLMAGDKLKLVLGEHTWQASVV
ncbi:fumarylacetoacetate hydrolase family protein [Psychrobacter sp. I-STPA10]|uniref:fumarylacetoacetate hydrolase family protein n=1 Tax=Psychrobacter sp. I-STPA10 TaxID=2585769 RepID=UPI001E29BA21|nr:fumarylacetoacetate hydrolase family protein [Psychrobacter sp. I-STPA10]